MPRFAALVAIAGTFAVASIAQVVTAVAEYPTASIREQQIVVVDGAQEAWQLLWESAPKPYCEAKDIDISITCPCMGFAYGEAGVLILVRIRNGLEIERLNLTPFFLATSDAAVVQRWPADDDDFKYAERSDFQDVVVKRKMVQVMHFGDYDHDGNETEFYLQTDSLPCGKSSGIVVGLSNAYHRLHVFGTATDPTTPLYMQKEEWEELRRATGPLEVEDWQCGDHGAETETRLWLQWTSNGIDGLRREYSCPADKKTKRLTHEGPL